MPVAGVRAAIRSMCGQSPYAVVGATEPHRAQTRCVLPDVARRGHEAGSVVSGAHGRMPKRICRYRAPKTQVNRPLRRSWYIQ